nr:fimbrial protein [Serratia fonticola]
MWVITNISMVLFCLFIVLPLTVKADYLVLGEGRVNMQGSIIDSACTIAVENNDQTINIGVLPVEDIVLNGQGRSKPFVIALLDCDLTDSNYQLPGRRAFQVTFDGDAEGDLFSVRGTASGIALRINDVVNDIVKPGKPLRLINGLSHSIALNYTATLVANNQIVNAGIFVSSVRFKLDYF